MQLDTLTINNQPQPATEEGLLIRYIAESKIIAVKGRSTGVEVLPAYTKLIEQTRAHFQQFDKLTCFFNLTVINASTTKLLFNLFSVLTKEARKGSKVVINWIVEGDDDDLMDIGLDFKNALDLDFRIVAR